MEKMKFNWIITILTIVSCGLLIYISIYIFNYYKFNDLILHYPPNQDNSKKNLNPNEIGDSIGGILNPIIAFTAAILTFLAFYIQYEANKDQRKIFYETLKREEDKREDDFKVNLRIFKNLLESMVEHFKSTGENLPGFFNSEREFPLHMNTLKFTTDNSYEIFKNLDFKEIYASVLYNFKNDSSEWEKDFTEVLRIIDFYDKLIFDIRNIFKNHIEKKHAKINEIGEILNLYMNDIFSDDVLKNLDGLADYMAIIYNKNPDGSCFIPEDEFGFPDINKLYAVFFPKFLQSLYVNFANSTNQKEKFKIQLDLFNHEFKKLGAEKAQAIYYSNDLENNYNDYFENEINFEKIISFINRINYG